MKRSIRLNGTNEIGFAVMSTTLTVVAVFVPVAFMKGIIGKFFYQFGVTMTVASLLSLVEDVLDISAIDLAGVHYPQREQPFEVVYHLLSHVKNHRVRLKVATDEDTPVPSIPRSSSSRRKSARIARSRSGPTKKNGWCAGCRSA